MNRTTTCYLFPNDIGQNFDTNSKNRLIGGSRERELSGTVHTRLAFAEFGSIERVAAKIPHLFAAIAFRSMCFPRPLYR